MGIGENESCDRAASTGDGVTDEWLGTTLFRGKMSVPFTTGACAKGFWPRSCVEDGTGIELLIEKFSNKLFISFDVFVMFVGVVLASTVMAEGVVKPKMSSSGAGRGAYSVKTAFVTGVTRFVDVGFRS